MPALKPHAQALMARWMQLSRRDRRVLAVLALSLVAAVEMLLVWPIRTQRLLVQSAVDAERHSQREALAGRQAERIAQVTALRDELVRIETELTGLGAVRTRAEPLAQLMQRSVSAQGLVLRGLRALPVEDTPIEAPTAAAAGAAAAAAASAPAGTETMVGAALAQVTAASVNSANLAATGTAAPAEAGAGAHSIMLYRHRVELRVAGPTLPLMQALDALAQSLQPLRVEKVRVAAAGQAGMAEATLTLATIRTERTWLEL